MPYTNMGKLWQGVIPTEHVYALFPCGRVLPNRIWKMLTVKINVKKWNAWAVSFFIYPRFRNHVITVQLRDHPYSRRNQPVPLVTTGVPPVEQRDASGRCRDSSRTPWANLGRLGCFRNTTPWSTVPKPSEPWWTLVHRGEPGRSRITLINIWDHRGQPAWYRNEKHFPGWSRCLPGDPGTFPVLSRCYRSAKTPGWSGTGHKSFEHFKTFFLSVPAHPGCPRWSWIIPVSARFNPRWPRFTSARHPGSSGAAGTAQPYSVTGA